MESFINYGICLLFIISDSELFDIRTLKGPFTWSSCTNCVVLSCFNNTWKTKQPHLLFKQCLCSNTADVSLIPCGYLWRNSYYSVLYLCLFSFSLTVNSLRAGALFHYYPPDSQQVSVHITAI